MNYHHVSVKTSVSIMIKNSKATALKLCQKLNLLRNTECSDPQFAHLVVFLNISQHSQEITCVGVSF